MIFTIYRQFSHVCPTDSSRGRLRLHVSPQCIKTCPWKHKSLFVKLFKIIIIIPIAIFIIDYNNDDNDIAVIVIAIAIAIVIAIAMVMALTVGMTAVVNSDIIIVVLL